MTRRAFLFTPAAFRQTRGVHVTGTLTASEGYYALCSESGRCHPTDTIALVVHPSGFFAKDFAAMAGRLVQVSVFPLA